MQVKLNWALSRKAKADLEKIWLYNFDTWSVQQAEHYVSQLYLCFNDLTANPDIGRDASSLRRDVRRYECESHVIFYKKRKTDILIIRVLHERMDPSRHV